MTPREFSHTDRNVQLSAIFTQWFPLADAVLKMVSAHLPSPLGLSEERVEDMTDPLCGMGWTHPQMMLVKCFENMTTVYSVDSN